MVHFHVSYARDEFLAALMVLCLMFCASTVSLMAFIIA